MAVLSSTLTTIADNYSWLSIGCDLWWEGAGLWGSMGSSGMGVWGHEQDVIWVERWQLSRQSQFDIHTWTVLASAECLDSDYNSDFLHRHRWWVLSAVQSTFIPWIRLYALNMFSVLTKFYSVFVRFVLWMSYSAFEFYAVYSVIVRSLRLIMGIISFVELVGKIVRRYQSYCELVFGPEIDLGL